MRRDNSSAADKPAQTAPDAESLRTKRPRLAGLIVGAIALAGLFAFVFHVGDIGAFAEVALKTEPRWLAFAIVAQILAFATQALVWAIVLRRRGAGVRAADLLALSIGKLFADQAIPSAGVSGAFFFVHALSRRGVPPADAFTAFVFGASSFILAFAIFAAGALAILAFSGGPLDRFALNISDIHYLAIASLLLVFAALVFYAASQGIGPLRRDLIAKARETVARAFRLIYVERGLFAVCLLLQALARILDGVTLWIAFQALGGDLNLLAAVTAVSLASLAATIAPTPMGLGSFEAGLIAALSTLGHGIETSLAGGLIYRGLSLGLPLAIGFVIVQRELLRK